MNTQKPTPEELLDRAMRQEGFRAVPAGYDTQIKAEARTPQKPLFYSETSADLSRSRAIHSARDSAKTGARTCRARLARQVLAREIRFCRACRAIEKSARQDTVCRA
jgi:hypothetical protein